MGRSLLRGTLPRERQLLFADGEVPAVENLGNDVDAVLELEIDQVGFAVLHFVQSRFFPRCALDVGKGIVVVDRGNQERFARGRAIERVVELKFRCVTGAEVVDLFVYLDLRGVQLIRRLRAQSFQFLFVRFGLTYADIAVQTTLCGDAGALLGFHKNLEVGFGIRIVADLGQHERIDVAGGGNEIQVPADAALARMALTEFAQALAAPEFFFAGVGIENLFVIWQDDKRREAQLRADRHDVLFAVFHDTRRFGRGTGGRRLKGG